MIAKYIKNVYISYTYVNNKFNLPGLFDKIFTRSIFSKIIIVFSVGLVTRIIVFYIYDINVFVEFFNRISIIYYSFMAIFVVVLNEVFAYFDINIIPKFHFINQIKDLSSLIYKSISQFSSKIRSLNSIDFNLKSIIFSFKSIVYYKDDSNKLTIGGVDPVKIEKPIKIGYVLNKDNEGATSSSNPNDIKGKASANTLATNSTSSKSVPFFFVGDADEMGDIDRKSCKSNISNRKPVAYPNSSVYSLDSIGQPTRNKTHDFPLYGEESNFNTSSTMTPLFNNSQLSVNRTLPLDNSLVPSPLNLEDRSGMVNQNTSVSIPTLSEAVSPPTPHPYGLSGNGVLPNHTFYNVGPIRGNIPLNKGSVAYTNNNLPLLPNNCESRLNGFGDTSRFNDPCSTQYISRHKIQDNLRTINNDFYTQDNNYYDPNISNIRTVDISKPGLKGKVKLVFKSLGDKFQNGINKIESAYIKYERIGKRHII